MLASFVVVAMAAAVAAAPAVPPRPSKYVTDLAAVVDPARLSALNERLAAFERETSNQVVVYVERKLPPGATLEEWSTATMNAWGVGQKDKDNGVGLLVFIDDRVLRIEVGYGLERALSNDAAGRIIKEDITPHFRKGDFAAGLEAGVDAILQAARTAGYKGTGRTVFETPPRRPGQS